MEQARLWIGGAWGPSASGASFEARSPATGEALGRVAEGARADADRAGRAANAAAPAMAALSSSERARFCHRIADAINVNESTNYWELHVPYGGVRQSGVGRIGGKHSLWEMTDLKTIVLDLG